MKDSKRNAMRQEFLSKFEKIAESYDPTSLPDDEAWKNDLDAIAEGLFAPPPSSATKMNKVQRYMMLSHLGTALDVEKQIVKQDTADVFEPETLIDFLTQVTGIVDAIEGGADPSKINPHSKKEIN
jgi:hypothetical protein